MAETVEVTSVEDSSVMGVSLCRTATEGVQSTSCSWRRRLLLAVAPVLGVALAAAALSNKAAPSGSSSAPAQELNAVVKGDVQEYYSALAVPDPSELDLETMCSEDFNISPYPRFPRLKITASPRFPGPNSELGRKLKGNHSELGRKLKAHLEYRRALYLEPTSELHINHCRFWSWGEWKFFCVMDTDSVEVVVTRALRVMKMPSDPFDLGMFEALYRLVRPQSLVFWGKGDDLGYMGLSRPAFRARSLFDLSWEMQQLPRGLKLNLALIVHAALSRLPTFYSATKYAFHGQLSAHKVEVLVGGSPEWAYVTGYADAIAWHMQENLHRRPGLALLAPPEAAKTRDLTDKFDTWSMGLATAQMLCRRYPPDRVAAFEDPSRRRFVESCRDLSISKTGVSPDETEFRAFYDQAMEFFRTEAPEFQRVLVRMIAVDPDDRWGVLETLEKLGELISELAEKE